MFQQGAQLRRFHVLRGDVAAACHLESGRKVRQHHAQRFLMLCYIVGKGARHCVLKQAFVRDQPFAIDRFDLCRIEIHRNHADEHKDAQDDVQDWNA